MIKTTEEDVKVLPQNLNFHFSPWTLESISLMFGAVHTFHKDLQVIRIIHFTNGVESGLKTAVQRAQHPHLNFQKPKIITNKITKPSQTLNRYEAESMTPFSSVTLDATDLTKTLVGA